MLHKKGFIILTSILLLFMLARVAIAQQYAIIYRRNGDRYTGYWRGADKQFNRIELLDGQLLRIPVSETLSIVFPTRIGDAPDAVALKHLISGKQLVELEMFSEAKEEFRAAIRAFPRYADAHYELGLLMEKEGNVEEAMRFFGRVVTINPQRDDMTDRFKTAFNTYLSQGDYSKAAESGLMLFESYPNDPTAESVIYQVGFLFAEKLNNPDKAITALTDAVESFPLNNDVEKAYYTLGLMYQIKGDSEIAVEKMTFFIDDYPQGEWLDDAYLIRGKAYLELRRNEDAIADFNQIITLSTDDIMKREARMRRDESAWNVYTVSNGLPSNVIQALAVDGEFLWVGTPKGISKFNVTENIWTPISDGLDLPTHLGQPTQPDVRALAVDERELWIGTLNNGIIKHDKMFGTIEKYQQEEGLPANQIYAIALYEDEVWVGTPSGVASLDRISNRWTQYTIEDGLPADGIISIAVTADKVWAGTARYGIGIFDKKLREWTTLTKSDLPDEVKASNAITHIAAAPDMVLFGWYADAEHGYCAYDMTQNEWFGDVLAQDETIILSDIYLATGQDEAWISTNVAVYRGIGDLKSLENWAFIEYPRSRLGADMRVKCFQLAGSVAWVGTTNGIGRVDGSILARW